MRKTSTLLALAFLGTAFAAGPVPRKAPEFVIQMQDGKQTLLSSYRGKDVVLAFMHTTCSHCQKMAQTLSQLQTEYGKMGVQMLGATFDKDAAKNVPQFNKVLGVNFPCGYSTDENVMHFLQQPPTNPPFIPILIFIDSSGTIRAQHLLTADDGPETAERKWFDKGEMSVRAEIEKLLKVSPVSARATSQR
jgi:peroxiredoxin